MSPEPSPFCTEHADDEWCDDCFIPSVARQTVADLDTAATWEELIRELNALPDPSPLPATRFCVNRRHVDGSHYPGGCDRPYPRPPLVHRATGAVAVATLVTATAAAVVVAEAWGWWGSVGRLHVEAAKQRAHDAWCRTAG